MDKKKILIVCRGFYPEQSPRAFRATELAKEFARQGHDVKVVTPYRPEKEKHAKQYGYLLKDLGQLTWPIPQIKGTGINKIFLKAISRFLSLFFEYPMLQLVFQVNRALKDENSYDMLISVAVPYPIHWGVAWSRKKNHKIAKTWVADCGDPYYINHIDSFRKPFYFKYIEKWFSRRTDYITIPKEEMKITFFKEFHTKIVAIPQGFNFSDVKLYAGPIINNVPTFAFAGGFIKGARDPKALLEYLSILETEFKFIIYTQNTALVEPYLLKLANKIEIREYISRDKLLYELSRMDFLVNIGYDPATQSPSKLIDYALTRRPILSIDSSNFNRTILDEFLNKDYTNAFTIPEIEIYNIENVVHRFLNLAK